MAKTYELYHNGDWIPAEFVKDSEELNRIWVKYQHVEQDEETGEMKPAIDRTIHVNLDDASLRVTEE